MQISKSFESIAFIPLEKGKYRRAKTEKGENRNIVTEILFSQICINNGKHNLSSTTRKE